MNFRGITKKFFGVALVALPMAFVSTTLTGCLTDDEPADTTGTPVAELKTKTILLGAQDNTNPSSLDLDTWVAYTAAAGAAYASDIDIIFAYSTASTMAALYSPNIAKNGVAGSSGGFDFLQSWGNVNTTLMREVTVPNIADVKTQADINALYNAGSDPTPVGRIQATAGKYIVAKSDNGLSVLIKVDAVTAAANGTTNLSGWAKW